MKNYFMATAVLLLTCGGWAQNSSLEYKYALKVYNLSSYDELAKFRRDGSLQRTTYTSLRILHPTLAFQWKTKKNNFHEIELIDLTLNRETTATEILNDSTGNVQIIAKAGRVTTTQVSLRYEYILNFKRSTNTKFVPSIGFAANPYFREINFMPQVSSSFPSSDKYIGLRTFVVPRLTWYVKPRLFIDVNLPICFSELYFLADKENDPGLPANEKNVLTLDYRSFPKVFSGRIGIGLKL